MILLASIELGSCNSQQKIKTAKKVTVWVFKIRSNTQPMNNCTLLYDVNQSINHWLQVLSILCPENQHYPFKNLNLIVHKFVSILLTILEWDKHFINLLLFGAYSLVVTYSKIQNLKYNWLFPIIKMKMTWISIV